MKLVQPRKHSVLYHSWTYRNKSFIIVSIRVICGRIVCNVDVEPYDPSIPVRRAIRQSGPGAEKPGLIAGAQVTGR